MEIFYFLTISWNTIDFQVYILSPTIFKFICHRLQISSRNAIAFANLEQGRTATPSVSETISEV